jgi:hypothetical protein
MAQKKYFHELEQSEIDSLIKGHYNWASISEEYSQPSWCTYPEALNGLIGCWSLTDTKEEGSRALISEDFCKECEYCKLKTT